MCFMWEVWTFCDGWTENVYPEISHELYIGKFWAFSIFKPSMMKTQIILTEMI